MILNEHEKAVLAGHVGTVGDQMAMEVVVEAARMLGAGRLVRIETSHIDGCLYHGDSGALYCEELVNNEAMVRVPTTTNVGGLNLLKPDQSRLPSDQRKMAYRLMVAHERMGCRPTWTCAPYQAGARPFLGQQVAWGESNAVAFVNTVLGARTNRYGDFLDIACAISARAPYYGLHSTENRRAKLVLDVSDLSTSLKRQSAFYPVLGTIIGRLAGETVCAVTGLPRSTTEDELKALCAAAASTGAVALAHIVGVTPEAPDLEAALGGQQAESTVCITQEMVIDARNRLSEVKAGPIDCVALGSPHFSARECRELLRLAGNIRFEVPVYVCLGRHTLGDLQKDGSEQDLIDLGVELVVDTCVVATPILPSEAGVMMTNSAKFAHYAIGNTGHVPVFGTLSDCVASAQAGHVIWDEDVWS